MISKLCFSSATCCIIGGCLWLCSGRGLADEAAALDFEDHVAPILIRNCLECHQARNPSGGLALDTADGIATGGENGAAVAGNSAADSLIIQRISAGEMPPPQHGESRALSPAEVEILRQWIDGGAFFMV